MLRFNWLTQLSICAVVAALNAMKGSTRILAVLAFSAAVLAGCGGGGDSNSSSGSSGGGSNTYTLGGTVSGLSGSVGLYFNGGNNLLINASGTFAFNATLANGASYTIGIYQQPVGQVCSITSGASGTIANANVTNVTVACAPLSITGSVSGLTKDGLVLQLNRANDLAVPAASSNFSFPSSASLGGGAFYVVHIKTQPTGQTCTILNSTGIVTAAAPTISGATAPAVACIDNVTDAFSGTYQVQTYHGDPVDTRVFLTFSSDGTFVFGFHADDQNATCANNGNGVEYGVYNWNQTTQVMQIVSKVLDTTEVNGENCSFDPGSTATLTKNDDGTLSWIVTDSSGPREEGTLASVPSTAGALVGSWGDNQGFVVFSDPTANSGKIFSVTTKSIVQSATAFPGIEDGCYALTGTTASGSFTTDFSANCTVIDTLKGLDTTGPVGYSGITAPINFTVSGDSIQAPAGPVPPIYGTVQRNLPTQLPSTYSITATINGLTGVGLALQNNGSGNVTVASGATSVVAATGIGSGTTYAVAVRTQPTGQYCTVANGSGIVFANVTNVAVTCITIGTTTYSVSGTISGLTGTGLALRLNGQTGATFNVTPASGSTTFAFTAGLQTGTAYSVSVLTQPTGPTQACFVSSNNSAGMIGTSSINVAINCINSAPYNVSGTVSGLTATGLSLRLSYADTYTGVITTAANLSVLANATAFNFTDTIPANGSFDIGIVTQPAGQTCTIIKGRAFSLANFTAVGVACVNNATDPLSGTYSFVDAQGRGYVNFNADGTYTTALIHNDWRCNTSSDTRNGNGVEYGVFSWTQSTGALQLVGPVAIDTNGDCGFNDNGPYNVTRVGNTIELRETSSGPVLVTATAMESTPSSLVGAWVREAGNGSLLVFDANTFLFVETQLAGLFPLGYGQERGCYTVSASTVTMTIDASCRPDGFAAYDLNSGGGLVNVNAGVTTRGFSFTLNDANTLTFNGVVYKRTQPN